MNDVVDCFVVVGTILSSPSSMDGHAIWHFCEAISNWGRSFGQALPHFQHVSPLSGEHTILQAVETLPMDRWQELSRD